MSKIIQLPPHLANLIAAGEVVERPASAVKELLENAVDAGASKITVEIRDGGMTFLRVTDNGCGMSPQDARTAFLRHATSKLHSAEELAAISTMGFRGEALAAIASVSRIDLLTKPTGALSGTSLHLESGAITESSEAGCPEGTTIVVRDLFFNTPARMKFMKSDAVEGGRVAAAVQLQALAHPEVAFTFLRDGKQVLSTPGAGSLDAAIYCVYGRACAAMLPVNSRWENYQLNGYVAKPTDARPSRNLQTFFVNGRPVKSRLMVTALEEAYRNRIMVGKYPACVLHLTLPAGAVDVNVHPAKTEVKFLNERAVFECIHYGVLAALNKAPDRPAVRFPSAQAQSRPDTAQSPSHFGTPAVRVQNPDRLVDLLRSAPKPKPEAAAETARLVQRSAPPVHAPVILPQSVIAEAPPTVSPQPQSTMPPPKPEAGSKACSAEPAPEQIRLPMPGTETPWRLAGELFRTYVIVEQGDEAILIDKHAAHERILFDRLKANPEQISAQSLITPLPCRLSPEATAELLANTDLLSQLGFELEEFGSNTVLLRQIPMDLSIEDAADALDALSEGLLSGRQARREDIRDELLHTVACKAAIKAGWHTDEQELLALVRQVMAREDLKYCPHGRPICITMRKKQLEKQFHRA